MVWNQCTRVTLVKLVKKPLEGKNLLAFPNYEAQIKSGRFASRKYPREISNNIQN